MSKPNCFINNLNVACVAVVHIDFQCRERKKFQEKKNVVNCVAKQELLQLDMQ